MAAGKKAQPKAQPKRDQYTVAPGRSIIQAGVVLCEGELIDQSKIDVTAMLEKGAIVKA